MLKIEMINMKLMLEKKMKMNTKRLKSNTQTKLTTMKKIKK